MKEYLVGDSVNKATRIAFAEVAGKCLTEARIRDLWDGEGFNLPPNPNPFWNKRQLFEAHMAQVRWDSPDHVDRVLRIFERILTQDAMGSDLTVIHNAQTELRRDGYRLNARGNIGPKRLQRPKVSAKALAEAIAEDVQGRTTWASLSRVLVEELHVDAVEAGEESHHSKRSLVMQRLNSVNLPQLAEIARRILEFNDSPDLQFFVDALGPRGVDGELKNLIFAADGPKPDIVLKDAVNNVIEVVKNEQYCLVYDRPLGASGLSWQDLLDWWMARPGAEKDPTPPLSLAKRLTQSLSSDSPGEKLLFDFYRRDWCDPKTGRGFANPALIPQVYLHYDPLTIRQRGDNGPLARQRMDFLMLLPDRVRVVIEVDGRHHYADSAGRADPKTYATMAREDRTLRLDGYDVYRFGAAELNRPDAANAILRPFFLDLFTRYRIPLK